MKKLLERGFVAGLFFSWMTVTSEAEIILTDTQDIKIVNASGVEAIGTEPSIAVHPDDYKSILVGINNPQPTCTGWFSINGGFTWLGDNLPAHSLGAGDPSVAILRQPSRYLMQGIALDTGQRVVISTAPFSYWAQAFVVTGLEEGTDRGFLCADNSVGQMYSGRLYSLWYRPELGGGAGTALRYSDNSGALWEPETPATPIIIDNCCCTWGGVMSVALAPSTSAPDVRNLYVAWPNANSIQDKPQSITFRKSDDGGTSFSPEVQITNYTLGGRSFAYRSTLPGETNVGANSAPSMTTDDLGNIYVAWGQKRRDGDGTTGDAQVYVSKSAFPAEGAAGSWQTPVSVTSVAGPTTNQWLPWITWDNEAKALTVLYMDDRNNSDKAEAYLAVSYDRGASFRELKLSNMPGSGDFMGDYIGIASVGGVAYPAWLDDRDTAGVNKTYTSPTLLGGIESTSISLLVSHSCSSPGNPRVRFQVSWTTLVNMDGVDKLTVTPPGQASSFVATVSTSMNHLLSLYAPCIPGVWKYQIESNKGAGKSQSAEINVTVASCLSCPPPCSPPCDLD